jgi:5-methylcytosine-specific restriction endonuclease McrA
MNNICLNCSSEYHGSKYRESKFCSKECASKFRRSPLGTCIQCNNIISKKGRERRLFCSIKCCIEHRKIEALNYRKQFVEKWLLGLISGNYGEATHHYVRAYLLEKAEFKCQKCGWNEINSFSGKSPLQINHIDGDSTRTIESNLEVLCPNCHSLTSSFMGLNYGNGRKSRRKGYININKKSEPWTSTMVRKRKDNTILLDKNNVDPCCSGEVAQDVSGCKHT